VTNFIRQGFQVAEADKTTVIDHGASAPRPQMPGADILYIIGLPGSGKSAVAAHLAGELGRPAHALPLEGAPEALERILAAGPAVVEVPHKLLTGEVFRQRLQSTGRVLYLMASVEAIAQRLGKTDEERERLGRLRSNYEPWFMQTLHLMAPADAPLDEVLADVLERVRM